MRSGRSHGHVDVLAFRRGPTHDSSGQVVNESRRGFMSGNNSDIQESSTYVLDQKARRHPAARASPAPPSSLALPHHLPLRWPPISCETSCPRERSLNVRGHCWRCSERSPLRNGVSSFRGKSRRCHPSYLDPHFFPVGWRGHAMPSTSLASPSPYPAFRSSSTVRPIPSSVAFHISLALRLICFSQTTSITLTLLFRSAGAVSSH